MRKKTLLEPVARIEYDKSANMARVILPDGRVAETFSGATPVDDASSFICFELEPLHYWSMNLDAMYQHSDEKKILGIKG